MPQTTKKTDKKIDNEVIADPNQEIFEKRFSLFMNGFSTIVESEEAPVAFAIVVDPKQNNELVVYAKGHEFDVAKAVAAVLRTFRTRLTNEIT